MGLRLGVRAAHLRARHCLGQPFRPRLQGRLVRHRERTDMSAGAPATKMLATHARPPVAWGRIVGTIAAAVVAGVFILPILWWGLASFKPTQEILTVPPKLFGFQPTLNWYRVVLGNEDPTKFNLESTGAVGRGSGGSTFYSIPYLRDSAIIGIGSTLLVLLLAAPAAYALSRFALRWRRDFA